MSRKVASRLHQIGRGSKADCSRKDRGSKADVAERKVAKVIPADREVAELIAAGGKESSKADCS